MLNLSEFHVLSPRSMPEALDVLVSGANAMPLAGGTDLMVYLEAGSLRPCIFLNLLEIAELKPTLELNGGLTIGALTTYRDIRVSPVRNTYPMLATAAAEVGALAIQSRGTWAGNIANASPAADGVPALMAYDAEVELASCAGSRFVALDKFFHGYKQTSMRADELIASIRLPRPDKDAVEYYRKVGTRRFQAISKTLLAGRLKTDADGRVEDVRLILASVAPYTLRARQTEDVIRGKHLTPELIDAAAQAVQDEIQPIDDIRSTEVYRRRVTANLVRDFLSHKSVG